MNEQLVSYTPVIIECKTITRLRGRNLIIHPVSPALCLSMGALSASRMTTMSTDNFIPSGAVGITSTTTATESFVVKESRVLQLTY